MSLLAELNRRNVFRVGMFYAVAGWVLLQVGDLLFGMLGVPPWGLKLLLGLLLLGFPLALVFAWVYELTPEGLKREHEVDRNASITRDTGAKLNVLIVVLLVIAIGLMLADRFISREPAAGQAGAPSAGGPGTSAQAGAAAGVPAPAARASSDIQSGIPAAGVATPAAAAVASIAVLPFVNMSEDKANEYFSDGLTEELLNLLANVQGLRVIARTSSFAYKGKAVKIADVARELDVDHVLEGSVRKAGKRVRITSQLIRASDSSHLWSETYDRNLDDIFAVQDEISSEVVDALKLRLLPASEATSEVGGTHVAAAYEAYLQGRYLRGKGEAETSLRGALAAFDEAIRLDPRYAQAYAGKAETLVFLGSNAYMTFDEGFSQARRAAERAIELAPDLADGYLTLGYMHQVVDGDLEAASSAIGHALQLNPGNYRVQRAYSNLESYLGRHDLAVAAAKKGVELDPISPDAHLNLSNTFWLARHFDEAEAAARRAIALDADRPAARGALASALLMQKRTDEALAAAEAESIAWQRMSIRALIFAAEGKPDLARKELAAMREKFGDAASYQYAEINAMLGDRDEAMRWLGVARRVRDPGLSLMHVDPTLDNLRPDPRFQALERELGYVGKS